MDSHAADDDNGLQRESRGAGTGGGRTLREKVCCGYFAG
jgi:hypothetical protein